MRKTALTTSLTALLTASIAQADELPYQPEITFTGGGVYNIPENATFSTFDLNIEQIPLSPCVSVFGCMNLDLEAHAQTPIYNSSLDLEIDVAAELVGRFSLFSHYSIDSRRSKSKKMIPFMETGPSLHLLRPYGQDYVSSFGGGFVRFGGKGKDANGKKEYHHVLLGVEGNSDSIFFNAGYNALIQIDETFAVGAYIGGSTPTLKADSKGFRRDNEFAGSFQIIPRIDIGNFTLQPKFELDGLSTEYGGSLPIVVGLSVGGVFFE